MNWKFGNRNQGSPRDYFDGGTATIPKTQWKMRRDTDARRQLTLLADGEPFWATDTDAFYIGDGVTLGGILVSDNGATRYKVKITSADDVGDYLQAKLVAGAGITLTKNNPGDTETLTITGKLGDVVGPASATDNAIARYDLTTGKLIQNSIVTVDDLGSFVGVSSLRNYATDVSAFDDWVDAATYYVDDKVKTATYVSTLTGYNCIQEHVAHPDSEPGVGYLWEDFWEYFSAPPMYLRGPVISTDGMSFNLGNLTSCGSVQLRSSSHNYKAALYASDDQYENWRWQLPIEVGAVGASLMVESISGNSQQLYWGYPWIGDTIGDMGTSGQTLITNGVDTISWVDRPYDLKFWLSGKPTANQVVYCERLTRAINFADDFAGSYATAEIGATAEVVFTIYRAVGLGSYSSVGTITFAAGGSAGSQAGVLATSGGALTCAAGDRIKIVHQASVDSTLEFIHWTLKPSSIPY